MTTVSIRTAPDAAVGETPWYDLLDDPEPPEDAMQQASTISDVMSVLKARYANDPHTLWLNQSNIIYDPDIPGSVISPDGAIVPGVEDALNIELERRSYRIDEWGATPTFVLEVASESTADRDLVEKREIYARIGVREYWRLDRTGNYYGEPLVGERLVSGEYERLPLHIEANGDIWSRSEALGVDFYYRVEEGAGIFLLRDSVTGEWLNTLSGEIEAHAETEAALHVAEAQAQRERQMRQEAESRAEAEEAARAETEARNRELLAELERLRRLQQG